MPQRYTVPFPEEHRRKISEASSRWWASLTASEREGISAKRRERWAKLTPEERERRLAGLRKPKGPQSDEQRRKLAEAQQALWALGGPVFKLRTCHTCAQEFKPNSGHQRYCTMECNWLNRRLIRHGLTAKDFWALLEAQGAACALCRRADFGWGRGFPLQIDHCHATGKVRGLLCGDCNTAIGRFGDDPARLRAAADYIERSSCAP